VKAKLALAVVAVALAVAPLPAPAIEQWYSRGIYPPLQSLLTGASNLIKIALLDLAAGALFAVAVLRLCRVTGWRARLRWTVTRVVVTSLVIYILFVLLWGLNYRRERLEARVVFEPSRVTKEALARFANDAIMRANTGHPSAHAMSLDVSALERTFNEAVLTLGAPQPVRVGVPKWSLLSHYFRRAAIDGMTNPLFLEIILNPELLDVERPFVMAHEWAHLAGYAHESEANFVAWLACLRGDPLARYSGWLAAYHHAAGQMTRDDRRSLTPLDRGPREDLRAIAARYERAAPLVRDAARDVYDSYLKANRVEEGIASYDAVVRLMLGTEFVAEGVPRLRSR
jgi:Protein of unknown function (DUF3810)